MDEKTVESIKRFLALVILIYFFGSLLLLIYKEITVPSLYERLKIRCDSIYSMEIKGKVIDIYNDRKAHDWLKYIIISNNSNYIFFYNDVCYQIDNIKTVLHKGDSVYKPANSFKNYIYKNGNKDSLIIVQAYSCLCGDSIPPDCDSIIEKIKNE